MNSRDDLKKKVELLLGSGQIHYVPSEKLVNEIIEQLIEEGKIPPREKWKELKSAEVPPGESE